MLDLRLYDTTGIQVAQKLLEQHPQCQILFVSGFPSYVSDVYDVPHLVLILKDQLKAQLPKHLMRAVRRLGEDRSLTLVTSEGVYHLSPEDIMYLERLGRATNVVLQNGSIILCREMLKEIMQRLPEPRFCFCHTSYVVNLQHVTAHQRTEFQLRDGVTIPVSRANATHSKSDFFNYLRLEEGQHRDYKSQQGRDYCSQRENGRGR